MVCKRAKKKSQKLSRKQKQRAHQPPPPPSILKDQSLNGKNHERDPLIEGGIAKETMVTSTGRNGNSKTTLAKDSAV